MVEGLNIARWERLFVILKQTSNVSLTNFQLAPAQKVLKMDLRANHAAQMAIGPQFMLPSPVTMAVKTALNLPIFAYVRTPLPGGGYNYDMRQVA